MGVVEWTLLPIVLIAKFVLIIYGILGFSIHKGKQKYFVLSILAISWIVYAYIGKGDVVVQTIWGLTFVVSFFEGKLLKKIPCYILAQTLISIIELLVWSVCVAILPWDGDAAYKVLGSICDYIGLILWIIVYVVVKKKRSDIHQIYMQLSFRHHIVIIFILFGLGLVAGTVQYSFMYEASDDIRKFALVLDMLVTLLILIGCIVFAYSIYTNKCIEMENKLNEERLVFQKNHYDIVIKKNEGIRQFRHDMRKHMRAISALCDAGNVEEVKQYVSKLSDAYQENEVVHTGNIVSDYFLNATIDELVKEKDIEFEYYIQGKFPDIMNINNNDLCVVMANALENAQHAMKRKKGKCRLFLEIKNNNGRLYIQIANSALPDEMEHLQRGKRDGHGYGTFNMRQVVEKYDGEIQFLYEDGMFVVKISIN